ncbi:hypothetical protein Hanom_Chr03g00235491 [Helianthus anomalus]
MKFFFIREEVMSIAMIFRELDKIEKEELPIPKGAYWYMNLLATPNRIFGEQVLVAAQMSDKWSDTSEEVPVLKFNGEGEIEEGSKEEDLKEGNLDTGATSKKGGSSRATVAAHDKGTLRFRQSNLEDYVVASDSLEGLYRIGEKKKSSAATSKSSGSTGSKAPESGATPLSIPVGDEEKHEEEHEEVEAAKLITRKRPREETAAGAKPVHKAVGPVIGKQSRLRSLYKFSPEALKRAPEKVKDTGLEKPKELAAKKTKFIIKPPRTSEKEVEKTIEEPAGDVIPGGCTFYKA